MDIAVNFKGGGSFVSLRPIFSPDGQNVFISWKNSVLEYNTKTGSLVHKFHLQDTLSSIIGFSFHNYNTFDCITVCSDNGKVTVWKYTTFFKLLEVQIHKKKLKSFHVISSKKENEILALVSYVKNGNVKFSVLNINNKTNKDFSLKLEDEIYFMDISGDKYFSVAQKNIVYFVNFNSQKISSYKMNNSRTFTCIACHPKEEAVLTGDSSGRLVVWQNLFSKEKTEAVFHWHTLPVNCVSFSTAGSYFYSGADECVLVKWNFDNPTEKQFLPRLPAGIKHVSLSGNNVFVAVATADNAIRILDSRLDQVSLIQHLVLGKQFSCGIIYDPRTKALVMNGNMGCVQFYAPSEMSLLYNVDIVGQNKITNERNLAIENTQITKVALSKSGLWLATVEERKDKDYNREIRLKFWNFNNEKQMFELNTSIEYPHEMSVNSLAFQPLIIDDNLRCITVGHDKKFKVWQLVDASTLYNKRMAWRCSSTAFYRDLPCQALAFSMDGSLMAVGFDALLTVWTPDSCDLKCSLLHPSHKEKVKAVQFGRGGQCHLLVSAGGSQLSVWNLLTLSLVWTVPVRVGLLVADRLSTNMVVLTKDKKVFVFEPASSQPIYSSDTLIKSHNVVAAEIIPSKCSNDARLEWYERSHLYFIDSNNELFCIGKSEDDSEPHSPEYLEDKALLGRMMPNIKNSTVQRDLPTRHLYEKDVGRKTIKKYLEAPLQTMVPIRFTCFSLLKSLVLEKEPVVSQ